MENEQKLQNEEVKAEKPQSIEKEKVVTREEDAKSEETVYRKFDSDDMVRLRDMSVKIVKDENGQDKPVPLSGGYQKLAIVLGIKKCPYFSDVVNEDYGVTDEIFQRRYYKEFRKIPVQEMDRIFKEVSKHNNADFDPKVMQKN